MPQARVGALTLDYELRGEGPPLLMICGFRRNRSVWGEALLAPLAERFRLILFDNRGTGHSSKPEDGYSIEAFADDAAGLLRELEIPRAFVFGVSMGGMVTQRVATRHPDLVAAIAIGCSRMGGADSTPGEKEIGDLLRILPSDTLSREQLAVMQLPAYVVDDFAAVKGDFLRDFFQAVNEHPTPDFAVRGHIAAIDSFDGSAEAGDINAPTLVITGAQDRLIPAENSKMLAERIPGAELVQFSDAAHFFWVEKSAETATELTGFFSRQEI